MTLRSSTLKTPVGPLTVIARDHTVVAAGFTSERELIDRLAPSEAIQVKRVSTLGPITDDLKAYFDGDVEALERISVEQSGSPFKSKVWKALRTIPPGKTVSYSTLARRAGSSSAVRAAASGCATNLVAPIVPCHRVVRSDGSLGGYGYGLEKKRWLLDHEAGS